MSSSFGGIQQAAGSIAAARYGLEVVSQNIANANTPGYTRQVSQQAAVDAVPGVPRLYTAANGPGGVTVIGTARMNDAVLDARARAEHARGAYADTTAANMSAIEQVFPEPSDTGLAELLNDFWNAWAPVANDPGSQAPRAVLLQKANTVAATLNAMSQSLSGIGASTQLSLDNALQSANSAAKQLFDVNRQIAIGTATGANVNPLLDQRDVLVDQLSSLVGGQAQINSNGTATVAVDGTTLVGNGGYAALSSDAGHRIHLSAPGSPPVTAPTDPTVTLTGGRAAADVTAFGTLQTYQDQLDAVAQTLVTTVNGAQASGFDLYGNAGQPMFTGTDAAHIAVALTQPSQLAASALPTVPAPTPPQTGNLDGSNALMISGLGASASAPDTLYQKLVGTLASASALAQQQQITQASVSASVDSLRTAASGVSYDEEVSNMLTYQRAYQASSRVLTTLDDMLDTLINHTGLVGRG